MSAKRSNDTRRRGFAGSRLTRNLFEKTLQGTRMGSNRFRIDIPSYLELYQQGRLRFDELVSRRIGLDDIERGLTEMGGESARTVIEFP